MPIGLPTAEREMIEACFELTNGSQSNIATLEIGRKD